MRVTAAQVNSITVDRKADNDGILHIVEIDGYEYARWFSEEMTDAFVRWDLEKSGVAKRYTKGVFSLYDRSRDRMVR